MSSHGDDFEVTAIQLASLVSAMSNGGKLVTPHVPRSVEENTRFKTEVRRRVNIDGETWKRMLPGMIGAVNYGPAAAYRLSKPWPARPVPALVRIDPAGTVHAVRTGGGSAFGSGSDHPWRRRTIICPRLWLATSSGAEPALRRSIDLVAQGPDDAPAGDKKAARDEEAQKQRPRPK
jgi:hypothetical protein